MSLRDFHLLFITLSAALAVFLGVWAFDRHGAGGAPEDAVMAVLSLAGAAALVAYGIRFRRRSRHWSTYGVGSRAARRSHLFERVTQLALL